MSRHQHRTVVKRVHPHARRWRLLAASVLLSGCVAAGVWWGQHLAGAPALLTDQSAALQDQINQLHLQAEADQQTLNELRDDLRQRAADIAALRDMLAFYRSVLAPRTLRVAGWTPCGSTTTAGSAAKRVSNNNCRSTSDDVSFANKVA